MNYYKDYSFPKFVPDINANIIKQNVDALVHFFNVITDEIAKSRQNVIDATDGVVALIQNSRFANSQIVSGFRSASSCVLYVHSGMYYGVYILLAICSIAYIYLFHFGYSVFLYF
jgi:hypothetical protein